MGITLEWIDHADFRDEFINDDEPPWLILLNSYCLSFVAHFSADTYWMTFTHDTWWLMQITTLLQHDGFCMLLFHKSRYTMSWSTQPFSIVETQWIWIVSIPKTCPSMGMGILNCKVIDCYVLKHCNGQWQCPTGVSCAMPSPSLPKRNLSSRLETTISRRTSPLGVRSLLGIYHSISLAMIPPIACIGGYCKPHVAEYPTQHYDMM